MDISLLNRERYKSRYHNLVKPGCHRTYGNWSPCECHQPGIRRRLEFQHRNQIFPIRTPLKILPNTCPVQWQDALCTSRQPVLALDTSDWENLSPSGPPRRLPPKETLVWGMPVLFCLLKCGIIGQCLVPGGLPGRGQPHAQASTPSLRSQTLEGAGVHSGRPSVARGQWGGSPRLLRLGGALAPAPHSTSPASHLSLRASSPRALVSGCHGHGLV